MKPQTNKIYQGHTLETMRTWDDEIIDMCITSPPYWQLRAYETNPITWDDDLECDHEWILFKTKGIWGGPPTKKMIVKGAVPERVAPQEIATCSKCGAFRGELGQEQDFDQFVWHLCDIFDEVKRILAPHGSLWVNLGDSFFGDKGTENKLNSQCLTMIPYRFAIEMINRGWILRNILVWHKLSGKPESCKSRFTRDYEHIFFFVKQVPYYFKQQFEPLSKATLERAKYNWCKPDTKAAGYQKENGLNRDISFKDALNPLGRNMRSVWSNIKPSNYKGAHFAIYPTDLLKVPIDAGCPREVCTQCGKPRTRIIDREQVGETMSGGKFEEQYAQGICQGTLEWKQPGDLKQIYWSKCDCNAPFRKGIVFDPFIGAGSTGLAAMEQNKEFIGTELNPEYITLAYERLAPLLKARKIDEWL